MKVGKILQKITAIAGPFIGCEFLLLLSEFRPNTKGRNLHDAVTRRYLYHHAVYDRNFPPPGVHSVIEWAE